MRDHEASTKRDLAMIPLTRKTFGDGMAIYADANGSYDVAMAIQTGRVMEDHNLAFLEEPVPFDNYDETKEIADALTIPVARGEQESSLRRFRWIIDHPAPEVVQPDLLYFGGMIRSIGVARMAAAAGFPARRTCRAAASDFSTSPLCFLCAQHRPFQQYKGEDDTLPVSFSATSSLKSVDGKLKVPSGPGLGVTIDPAFIEKAERLSPR